MSAIMLTPIGLLLALATPSPALADLRELERFRGTRVRVERERDDAARFAEIKGALFHAGREVEQQHCVDGVFRRLTHRDPPSRPTTHSTAYSPMP